MFSKKKNSAPALSQRAYTSYMILRANEQAVGQNSLASELKAHSLQIDLAVANQVLCQVDEELRGKLGQNHREINSQILKQTISILKHPDRMKGMSKASPRDEKNPLFNGFQVMKRSENTPEKSKGHELGI